MTKKITVTRKDIRTGVPYDHENCALALAGRRAFKNPNVRVGIFGFSVGTIRLCHIPIIAQTFIGRFDTHQPVKPFSFNVKLLQQESAK